MKCLLLNLSFAFNTFSRIKYDSNKRSDMDVQKLSSGLIMKRVYSLLLLSVQQMRTTSNDIIYVYDTAGQTSNTSLITQTQRIGIHKILIKDILKNWEKYGDYFI